MKCPKVIWYKYKKEKGRILKAKHKIRLYRNICYMIIITFILAQMAFMVGCGVKENVKIAPEHVFVYAENQPEDYPATQAANYFAQLVRERSNGRIEILVQSNGQMGDEDSVITQMGFGGVDFTRVSLSTLANDIPELNVLMMPYLYSSEEAMWKVLEGEIGAKFTEAVSQKGKGIRALSWYDAGARSFYSIQPIKKMEDLKGLNIRVQQSGVMADMVSLLGANPVKMIYSEVNHGLQTGVIDGAENNWSSYEFSGNYEMAGYCLVDEHNRIPELQLISENAWNQLTTSDQTLVSECAMESANYEKTLWKEIEEQARKEVEAAGVVITEISEEEKLHFQDMMQQLYYKYCLEDMELIQEIRKVR